MIGIVLFRPIYLSQITSSLLFVLRDNSILSFFFFFFFFFCFFYVNLLKQYLNDFIFLFHFVILLPDA